MRAPVDPEAERLLIERIDAHQVAGQQVDTTYAGTKVDTTAGIQCHPAASVQLSTASYNFV